MATKQAGKAKKAVKKGSKRIPSVKRLAPVQPLMQACGPSGETH
jgi:hypothetical protein